MEIESERGEEEGREREVDGEGEEVNGKKYGGMCK